MILVELEAMHEVAILCKTVIQITYSKSRQEKLNITAAGSGSGLSYFAL
jgi:hypothetical protein